MKTFEVTTQNAVVDAFHPDKLKAICFSRKDAEKVAAVFNGEHERKRADPELRKELLRLRARVERYTEILKEHDLLPKPGRKKKAVDPNAGPTEKQPRKKGEYKARLCPGVGRDPHLFNPVNGRQTMCTECRERMKTTRNEKTRRNSGLTTIIRSGSNASTNGMTLHVPTVEEVADMQDAAEREKWTKNWSPAEWQQYRIGKTRKERAAWKEKRQKAFRFDDPIMGVEIGDASSPKVV